MVYGATGFVGRLVCDYLLASAPLAVLGGAIIFAAVIGKAVYDTRGGLPPELTTAPDVPLM